MSLTYFKRYRMEIDLAQQPLAAPQLPDGYELVPWTAARVGDHAETKYLSFREEIDAVVFPCLGDLDGCEQLMREISKKKGFLPSATWLVAYRGAGPKRFEHCGTIQGIRADRSLGGIQNVGVVPFHRGRGLATALIAASLAGFREAGLQRAYLEVTAQNDGAIRLYERLGFFRVQTLFKAVELAYS